ncbi:MAG: hypothetical protein ACREU3_01175 [Steroidobacteraceae bacterium]
MPAPNATSGRRETSTHRTAQLTRDQIWQLGYAHVENQEAKRLIKARGTGLFKVVRAQGLRLDVNGPPVPRHVDIVGWPPEKDACLMRATEIANTMQLEMDPRSGTPRIPRTP